MRAVLLRCIDIDCRFAAVDALGNFFKSLNNTSTSTPASSGSSAGAGASGGGGSSSSGSGKIGRNTLGSTSQRVQAPVPEHSQAYARSDVDDTLRECLRVVVSNLHACVAQSLRLAPPSLGLLAGGGGGIQDRMFISVLRTLIALYAYLHTLNLNIIRQQQGSSPLSAPLLLLYHQQSTDKSRKQAQEYVPEILSDVQLVLHKAYQLLKIENKFSCHNKAKESESSNISGEKMAVIVTPSGGDHDSTVRFLHHSLQLIATLFLFEKPGVLLLISDCYILICLTFSFMLS